MVAGYVAVCRDICAGHVVEQDLSESCGPLDEVLGTRFWGRVRCSRIR